ncbi:MAG: type II toxin-antitoxin system VapC family toxin [Hyphomicrobium sp.]
MIVIDSSALVAIINREPERVSLLHTIEKADGCFVSAVTLLETRMVVRGRFGAVAFKDLAVLLTEIDAEVVHFDHVQMDVAFAAFERYGKGMGTAAKLNMGDCVSYALAKHLSLPLLYKGDDFKPTDIVSAA